MIAAGTESMSVMPQMTGNKTAINPAVFERDENLAIALRHGADGRRRWPSAGRSAARLRDAFAVESHRRATAAIAAGHFRRDQPRRGGSSAARPRPGEVRVSATAVDVDEGRGPIPAGNPWPGWKPVFHARGSVTAGNSSQMSDGAGRSPGVRPGAQGPRSDPRPALSALPSPGWRRKSWASAPWRRFPSP